MLPRHLFLAGLLATGGCTLLLDPDEHRGGTADGGADCDVDGDGVSGSQCGGADCDDANAARYPGAPPICGNLASEGCPGEPALLPMDLFAPTARQGRIPLTTIATGTFLADIGLGALSAGGGGHGQATVIFGRDDGSGAFAPERMDASLDALGSATTGTLTGSVTASSRITSVSVFETATDIMTVALGQSGAGFHLGQINLTAGTQSLGWNPDALYVDGVGIIGSGQSGIVAYRVQAAPTKLVTTSYGPGAAFYNEITTGVPSGNLNTVISPRGVLLLHDGATHAYFADMNAFSSLPIDAVTFVGQQGRMTFAAGSDGVSHVVGYGTSTSFVFESWRCRENGVSTNTCTPEASLQPHPTAAAGALGGEVFDGLQEPSGRYVFLTGSHHADGDTLELRFLAADRWNLAPIQPIVLVDTRATDGSRVVDAHLERLEALSSNTLVVALALGSSTLGSAPTRISVAGIRACAAD